MENNQIQNSRSTPPLISSEAAQKIQKNWKTRTVTLLGAGAVAAGSLGLVIPAVAVVGLWWLGAAYKTSKHTFNKLTKKDNLRPLKEEIFLSKSSKPLNIFFETVKIAISPQKKEIVSSEAIILDEKKCIREFFVDLILISHKKKGNFSYQNFLNDLDDNMMINLRSLAILNYKENKNYKLEFNNDSPKITIGEKSYCF